LRRGVHDNDYFQNAFNRHGEAAFEFVILAQCEESALLNIEQEYLDKHKAAKRAHGYNIWPTAHKTFQTAEMRAKLSKAHMGHKHPPEVRAKISAAQRIRIRTPETYAKVSKALTGRKLSPEHIAKWKAAQTFGPLTDEHKKKISEANKGRIVTAETRQKISASNKGKKVGIPSWNKGVPMSEEARRKLNNSLKGRVPWNKGTKGLMGAWNKGRCMDAQARANISTAHKGLVYPSRRRAVVQIDPKNGIVAFYPSIQIAARTTGARNINQCCRGTWETSKGYVWRYAA